VTARLAAIVTAALVVGAWASPPQVPERLSETGLYVSGTLTVDPANRPFAPQYPLWSDGLRKSRWVRVPAGHQIDASDVDDWMFPVNTRFWKEFEHNGRKVETRMLWRASEDRWSYATYIWNDAQTDATLAPAHGVPGIVEIAAGKRHNIPSATDCVACHENGGTPILGFTALQLSSDRDPGAPNGEPLRRGMLRLETLLDEQLLAPAHPDLAANPPRIPGGPRTRAALGYMTANCGHCHNERSTVATVRLPLRLPAYASARQVDAMVDALLTRTTKWDLPHTAPGTTALVAAGAPELSALFVRMRSRRPSSQMPPLGTALPDRQALDLVSAWIADLPPRKHE
jgi:cytochrome c553